MDVISYFLLAVGHGIQNQRECQGFGEGARRSEDLVSETKSFNTEGTEDTESTEKRRRSKEGKIEGNGNLSDRNLVFSVALCAPLCSLC
jgi:hypothetical protein